MFNLLDFLKSYKVIDFKSLDKLSIWNLSKQLKFLIDDNDIHMNDIIKDIKGPYGLSYCETSDTCIVSISGSTSIKFTMEGVGKTKIKTVEFMVK